MVETEHSNCKRNHGTNQKIERYCLILSISHLIFINTLIYFLILWHTFIEFLLLFVPKQMLNSGLFFFFLSQRSFHFKWQSELLYKYFQGGTGVGWRRSMRGKGNIHNTFNNKSKFLKNTILPFPLFISLCGNDVLILTYMHPRY